MILKVGAVVYGFLVQSVTPVPDVGGQMWRMVYEKNGAELVWLERKDDVKTFAIAFKTLPGDDTGVAHILEHAVLMGSEKYPVKSPFGELRRSSPCVFLNAMTAPDMTGYPFSTRNGRDFMNLADVYLDAVFHPTVLKSPMAFWQEGWHREIDPKIGNVVFNGVVYNEMKGVRTEPERVASREVLNYLYPDTVYAHDSGGNPNAIPSLTYEAFCTFYHTYYHPSNARIFLDGNVDLPTVLQKLDAVLSAYDRAEKVAPIPYQKPISRTLTIPYAATETTNRTILADAWSVGTYRDLVRKAALDVLIDYLAGSNEAPLKKALLLKGLCDDVYLYWCGYQQLPLVLMVRNTSEEKAATCRATVRETIDDLLKNGLDRARLRAIINRNEFSERELDGSRPLGLAFFSRAMQSWLYGGDPAAPFDLTGVFAQLRQGVDGALFETCLREAFVGNPHHVELTYVPSCTYQEKTTPPNTADLAALKHDMAAFTAYQKRKDSSAAKATIPTLTLADMPKSGRLVAHTIVTNGATTVITTKPTADGIAYVSAYFPADGLDAEELTMLPLLSRLFGKLPTAEHDALTLQTAVADKIGRLSFLTAATERGNFLVVEMAVLADQGEAAVRLLKEILLQTTFEDEAAIEKIRKQKCLNAEREVTVRGDNVAMCYAARTLSRRCASRDLLHGYGQVRWLQGAKVDRALVHRLAALATKVLTRDGLVLSVTDNLSATARTALCDFPGAAEGHAPAPRAIVLKPDAIAGIQINGDAGYSGTVAALPPDVPYDGAMRVASTIVSLDYLHKNIREMGGAYGTGIVLQPTGLIVCYTYRNPTPIDSLATIRRAGEALAAFAQSDEPLDRYIISSVAGMDPYRSPAAEASRPVELYLAKRTPADVERERAQALATTRGDLARIAQTLTRQLATAQSMVVGGAKQVDGLKPESVEKLTP